MNRRSNDWSQFSHQQIRCLCALDFAVPLHQTHLSRRYKVRGPTVQSCIRLALVRPHYLVEQDSPRRSAMPFFTLSQYGQAVKRDWLRWQGSVKTELVGIFSADDLRKAGLPID